MILMIEELRVVCEGKLSPELGRIKNKLRDDLSEVERRAIYGMICRVAYLNYIKVGILPDSVRARIYLGEKNYWVKELLGVFKEDGLHKFLVI